MTALALAGVDDSTPLAVSLSHAPVDEDAPVIYVVPAFNEVENLPRLLSELEAHPELASLDGKVIIVDDGSTDGTADVAQSYDGDLTVEVVRLGRNLGPGAAFRAGFAAALAACEDEALIVTLEADTTSDLEKVSQMLRLARRDADLVLASVHGGGRMLHVGFIRRTLSRGAGAVVRHALGVDARTVSSFFRVYRASLLRAGNARFGDDLIREQGFACKAELLAKLAGLGARVEEVPVDLDASRRIGPSKMRIGDTLVGYWRLVVRERFAKETA